MIVKSPLSISPDVEVVLAGTPFDFTSVLSLRILLEQNKHDMLELQISGLDPSLAHEYIGNPVKVSLSTGGGYSFQLLGNVDPVKPSSLSSYGEVNGSPFHSSRFVCMGASYAMRGAKSNAWIGFSPHDVVSQLAFRHKFSATVLRKDRLFDPFIQTNESDWNFLCRLAAAYGMSVNAHGTHLQMYDPLNVKTRLLSLHALFTIGRAGGDPTPAPGQILEFSSDMTKKEPNVSSVLASNGEVLDIDGSGNISTATIVRKTGHYDSGFNLGVQRAAATARLTENMDYIARVKVIGVAGCVPGGAVSVSGYSDQLDGFWHVRSVEHFVEKGVFFSELHIERNSSVSFSPSFSTFAPPPPSTFVEGSWVSTSGGTNVYT